MPDRARAGKRLPRATHTAFDRMRTLPSSWSSATSGVAIRLDQLRQRLLAVYADRHDIQR